MAQLDTRHHVHGYNDVLFHIFTPDNDPTPEQSDAPAMCAKHWYTICTTSAQRLRRWSNIVQMVYKCFVFTGMLQRRG